MIMSINASILSAFSCASIGISSRPAEIDSASQSSLNAVSRKMSMIMAVSRFCPEYYQAAD